MLKSQWNIDIGRIKSHLGELVRTKAERLTQSVFDGVVSRSPVREGQFRASWSISQGSPNYSTVNSGGTPQNPLPAPNKTARAFSDYPIFFVANGKPYGQLLEYGSSKQAPQGMIRLTLASLR